MMQVSFPSVHYNQTWSCEGFYVFVHLLELSITKFLVNHCPLKKWISFTELGVKVYVHTFDIQLIKIRVLLGWK